MIRFERNKDPKKALSIGRVNERVFVDIKEAAIWFSKYPEAYTDGQITDWGGTNPGNDQPFFDRSAGGFHHAGFFLLENVSGKLSMIKWVKENLHFSEHPEAIIGLRDAKQIVDTAEQIINMRLFKESFDPGTGLIDDLEGFLTEMIEECKAAKLGTSEHRDGYLKACNKIQTFIEKHKENETESSSSRKS